MRHILPLILSGGLPSVTIQAQADLEFERLGDLAGMSPDKVRELRNRDKRTITSAGVVRCACGKVISGNKLMCFSCAEEIKDV